MDQNISGVYSLLRRPSVFSALQRFIVRKDSRKILAEHYIKPKPGDLLLDIGCGPASMLPYLGDVIYTGLDVEHAYIEQARAEYKGRCTFIEARVQDLATKLDSQFDIAIAIGILHHLDDQEAQGLFRASQTLLRPGGRLIVSDPVLRPSQNPIASLVMRFDRGKRIRSKEGYLALARGSLRCIQTDLRSDFMRIPYDHCISVYQKPLNVPRE
jgi:SAM-dependent methyltransferase